MRFHGLLVVRDEADIIDQSVRYALTWADAIYVYDTGSVDGTWELLQGIAREEPRLILFRHEAVLFRNDLRAVLFEHFRDRFDPGDWIATVDADEFYHIPPPVFVSEQVRREETAVCYQLYDFKLTRQELSRLKTGIGIGQERKLPIEQRRRHYIPLVYAEPRLFRYRPSMQWVPPNAPFNLGFMAAERIPIRHYPNRDPLQMEARYRLRLSMRSSVGFSASPHWNVTDWRHMVLDATEAINHLEYWHQDSPLPAYHFRNHLASPVKRLTQRIAYSTVVSVLDHCRPKYPTNYEPERVPR